MNTARNLALLEVVLATALAHFIYKALKLAEPPGWNLAPGITLLAWATALMRLHRKRVPSFGVLPFPDGRAIAIVLGLTGLLVAGALLRGAPWARIGYIILGRYAGAGLAEELFFRGYAQTRVDAVFEKRWRVLRVPLGPGWLAGALLFGAIHVCNPTLWFQGRYELSWSWGLSAALSGLCFGWLRERSRGIWLPAFVHGFVDSLNQLWIV